MTTSARKGGGEKGLASLSRALSLAQSGCGRNTPMPAIQDSDSDEEAPNAPRLARPRTAAVQKPLLDDDDDLIIEDDAVAAPQGALKKRLQKAKQSAPSTAPELRKEQLKKGSKRGSGSAAASAEVSDDETPMGHKSSQRKTSDAASDSEDELVSNMKKKEKDHSSDAASSDPDSEDEEAWMAKQASQSAGGRAARSARRGTSTAELSSEGSESESEGSDSDGSDAPRLNKKTAKSSKSAKGEKKPRAPKPRKRSPLSDFEGEDELPRLNDDAALRLKGRFSDAPRPKAEQLRKLPSRSFLLVGTLGKRGTWELPYMDMAGKVNVELLKIARDKARGHCSPRTPQPRPLRSAPFAHAAAAPPRLPVPEWLSILLLTHCYSLPLTRLPHA